MSDLKKGSTIGGFEIITNRTKALHTHDHNQLTGYGNAALLDDGPGENINVDGLDDFHFSDFENNFVNIVGDTISGDLIIEHIDPDNIDSGINTEFANEYFHDNNVIILDYNPYISIDEDTFQITQISNTEIETTSSYVFINGDEHNLNSQTLDITSVGNNPNDTIYLYVNYDSSTESVSLDLDTQFFQNTNTEVIIAAINTNGSGEIDTIDTYNPYRWLYTYPIVKTSLSNGIVLTDSQGIIDDSWLLYKPNLTENISLDGPRILNTSGTFNYTITDYDVFSTYDVSITEGTVTINNDVITIDIPTINENKTITLTVSKNGNEVDFNISYIGEQYLSGDIDQVRKKTTNNTGPVGLKFGDMVVDKEFNTAYLSGIHNTGTGYSFKVFKYDIYDDQWTELVDRDNSQNSGSNQTETVVYSYSQDGTVQKIDSSGNEIWTFSGHTEAITDITIDQHENTYSSSLDNTVRKINVFGNQSWSFTRHNNPVYGVAVDQSGNVYSASTDQTVRKMDNYGNQIWFFSSNISSSANLYLDSNEFIYVNSTNGVHKLDSDGNEVWIFSSFNSVPSDLYIDDNDNIYTIDRDDYRIIKLDIGGNEVWSFTGHTDYITDISVDSNGNVYTSSDDNTARKLDSDGNEVWNFSGHNDSVLSIDNGIEVSGAFTTSTSNSQTYNAYFVNGVLYKLPDSDTVPQNWIWKYTHDNSELIVTVAVNENADVYIGAGTSSTGSVQKLDSDGNKLWGISNFNSIVFRIAVDQFDNVYSGSVDNTIKKIDGSGNELWTFNTNNRINFLCTDATGNVYASTSGSIIYKIDTNGNQIFSLSIPASITVNKNGNLYLGLSGGDIRKLDTSGNEIWTYSVFSEGVRRLTIDQNENIYAISTIISGSNGIIKKIDNDGNELWDTTILNPLTTVSVDPNGKIYIGSDEGIFRVLDNDGNQLWNQLFSFSSTAFDTACDPGRFGSGNGDWTGGGGSEPSGPNVYTGSADDTVKKIDNGGNEVWTYSNHTDDIAVVKVDENGFVYSGSYDNTVRKLDNDGNEVWSYTGHSDDIAINGIVIKNTSSTVPPKLAAYNKMTIIGDYVYVIGGSNIYDPSQSNNGLEASNSMFRINRFNNNVQTMNNLPIDIIYHDVTTDNISKIYLVGGLESIASNTFNNNVYEYDINSDNWTKLDAEMPYTDMLKGHICEYHRGRIYIHGLNNPENKDMVWRYNVVRDEWNVLNNNTGISKIYHNSAKYDSRIYIFGGEDSNGDKDHNFYEYYPELGTYSQIASYPDYFDYDDKYDYPIATDNYGYVYIYDYKQDALWRII